MNHISRGLLQKTCIALTFLGMSTILSELSPAVHAQNATFNTSNTFPKSALDLSRRGREKFDLGDYGGAISDFNEAMLLNPNDADVYFNRGLVLFKLEDTLGAISDFDHALILNPRHAMAYFHRAGVRYSLGEQTGAMLDLQLAAKLFLSQGDETRYQRVQKLIRQFRTRYPQ